MRLLVTGGCGFIGSNFVRHVLRERPSWRVTNVDALTYSGNPANLEDVAADPRYRFVHGDVCDQRLVDGLVEASDAVVHLAAESHVDRSIRDARPFIVTNVLGTHAMLEAARRAGGRRFVFVSTDEVYGSLPLDRPDLRFTEDSPLRPANPYSVSKASADMLARSYFLAYGLDVVIARCSNNLGPFQHPEKVIPRFVTSVLDGRPAPLYGDGLHVRDWMQVEDHCGALVALLERGRAGEAYNIGASNEVSNLALAREILRILGAGPELITRVPDRAAHDRRYAIDWSRIRDELGWRPTRSDWPGCLERTVRWYAENRAWWA